MSTLLYHPIHTATGRGHRSTAASRVRPGAVEPVGVPSTPLLACTLLRIDWSDAYAVAIPRGMHDRPPDAWAEAIFRAPPPLVLVQPGRVVLSTLVEVRNRRGRAYSALVRRVHPWVVRAILAGAVDKMAVSS